MDNRIEQFKRFVRRHPKLRYLVRNGEHTWQSLYEEWVMLGEEDSFWKSYQADGDDEEIRSTTSSTSSGEGQEFIKNALNYVKKLNPDDITKYINNAQKVLSLIQMFNGGNKQSQQRPTNYRPRRHIDPLFRRYDEFE